MVWLAFWWPQLRSQKPKSTNQISPYSMPLSRKMSPMVANVSFLFIWWSILLQSSFCSLGRVWTGDGLHGCIVYPSSPDPLRNTDITSTAASPIKADGADTTPEPPATCSKYLPGWFFDSTQVGRVGGPAQRTPCQGMWDWNLQPISRFRTAARGDAQFH